MRFVGNRPVRHRILNTTPLCSARTFSAPTVINRVSLKLMSACALY